MQVQHARAMFAGARRRSTPGAARPLTYLLIVVLVAFGVPLAYKLRTEGIFACPAAGYDTDHYLAYCNAGGFGDYEHGAFWFDLEPPTLTSARNADVMLLGDSRLQQAFSSREAADWFGEARARYFLLGFGYYGNIAFASQLLARIQTRARVFVVNVEPFLRPVETPPVRTVMHDATGRIRYESKRLSERAHRLLCTRVKAACGDQYVIFRSRTTGAYRTSGRDGVRSTESFPTAEDERVDASLAEQYIDSARTLLAALPARRECVIFTAVPNATTKYRLASTVAASVSVPFIAPQLQGLRTFDGSHLNAVSAERWSKAFFEAAGPQIRTCLDGTGRPAAGS